MTQYCGECIHYNYRSYKVCFGERNVSGGSVWYRIWSKFRCNIKKCQQYKNYVCNWFVGNEKYKERKRKYEESIKEFNKELEEYDRSVGVNSGI